MVSGEIRERLMKALAALTLVVLCTSTFAQAAGQGAAVAISPGKTYAVTPDGSGDPFAITCRPPQMLPGSRLRGPEVCKTNAVWAQYRKDGMEVAADGIHDVPSERWRSVTPLACHAATMGGGGTAAMIQANISQICD
jgi:hypothetical protein